jgi:hypothetical protein
MNAAGQLLNAEIWFVRNRDNRGAGEYQAISEQVKAELPGLYRATMDWLTNFDGLFHQRQFTAKANDMAESEKISLKMAMEKLKKHNPLAGYDMEDLESLAIKAMIREYLEENNRTEFLNPREAIEKLAERNPGLYKAYYGELTDGTQKRARSLIAAAQKMAVDHSTSIETAIQQTAVNGFSLSDSADVDVSTTTEKIARRMEYAVTVGYKRDRGLIIGGERVVFDGFEPGDPLLVAFVLHCAAIALDNKVSGKTKLNAMSYQEAYSKERNSDLWNLFKLNSDDYNNN